MGDEDHGAVVAGEAALELLDRLDVEVVRRLVEDEAVDAAGGEEREPGARALARREGRGRAEDVVGAEAELREQGARGSLLEVAEDVEQRLRPRQRGAILLELAEDDARAEPARAGGERQPAEQRVEQRRLAAAVRPGDREPVAPADGEVERAEPEGAALDDRVLEPDDDLAAARRRRERELELPRLVRLLDGLDLRGASRRTSASRPSTSSSCGPGRSRGAPTRPCGAAAPRSAGARRPTTPSGGSGARAAARARPRSRSSRRCTPSCRASTRRARRCA